MFAYECWHKDYPDQSSIRHGLTAGAAKKQYFAHLHDVWSEVSYLDIRAKKAGAPQSSKDFLRTAAYRGVPYARCGQRVKVGTEFGIIVGANCSANFDVFFPEGKHKGLTLNCHPASQMQICIEGVEDEKDLDDCSESINCGPCQGAGHDLKPATWPCHHKCKKHHMLCTE